MLLLSGEKLKKILLLSLLLLNASFGISEDLSYSYWRAVGKTIFEESQPIMGINTESIPQITLLKGQTEPVSFILSNTTNDDIHVNSISIIGNKYSKNVNYDFWIVKSWYMGSRTSISVSPQDFLNPKLTPELLLKDDDLVYIDEGKKKNYLRISDSDQIQYLDVSSKVVLMPNNAKVQDSKLLQPFTIKPMHGKQIWLNLSTANNTYAGKLPIQIKVDYRVKGTKKSLLIPLNIDMLPVALAKNKLNYGIYYLGRLKVDNRLQSIPKNVTEYRAELSDIYKHGVLYPI